MLRRIFAGSMATLERPHNEELHNFHGFTKYCYSDQIKEHEMGRACSIHGTDEKRIQNLGRKT
jgi:hypothetical protein